MDDASDWRDRRRGSRRLILAADAARAQTTIRLGKAQANQFAFVPADVGIDTGIFKKHGIDVEISAFGGDAKMMQALTAGGIDIALGGGPAFATIVKGAPMKAVAALADAPNTIMLVVLKDGPIKTVDDLKGRIVSVSTAGSLTYWLTQQLSRSQGWGDDGIKITPLGSSEAQIAALKTHQIDGVTTDSVTVDKFVETGKRPHPGEIRRPHQGFPRPRHLREQQSDRKQSRGAQGVPRRLVRDHRLHARPQAGDDRHCRQAHRRLAGRRGRGL